MPRQIHIPLGGLRPWPGGAWHVGYTVYQRVVAVGVEDGGVVDTDGFDGQPHHRAGDQVVVAWGVGPLYLLRGWSGPVVALACWQEVVSRASLVLLRGRTRLGGRPCSRSLARRQELIV